MQTLVSWIDTRFPMGSCISQEVRVSFPNRFDADQFARALELGIGVHNIKVVTLGTVTVGFRAYGDSSRREKIPAIKVIRQHFDIGLTQAKYAVENCTCLGFLSAEKYIALENDMLSVVGYEVFMMQS